MSQMVSCEVWYDNTWWETQLPIGWTFRRDQSIKNWPYLFESPATSQFRIWSSKNTKLSGWNFSIAPDDLTHEQKQVFLLTASDASQQDIPAMDISNMRPVEIAMMQHMLVINRGASLRAVAKQLTKHELGNLVGFTYKIQTAYETTWAGYFTYEDWMIRTAFSAFPDYADNDSLTALSILESLRFQGSTA